MPGGRAALAAGTLAGPPPDPQSDENRDPPPITPSGAGLYRRTVDLKQNNVSPTGNTQPGAQSQRVSRLEQIRSHDMSSATTTTDHKVIRRWIEERNGRPARVKGTADKQGEGILRIDFAEPDDSLEPISWEEFFVTFDDRKLEFLHQDETDGRPSRFFKFVREADRH